MYSSSFSISICIQIVCPETRLVLSNNGDTGPFCNFPLQILIFSSLLFWIAIDILTQFVRNYFVTTARIKMQQCPCNYCSSLGCKSCNTKLCCSPRLALRCFGLPSFPCPVVVSHFHRRCPAAPWRIQDFQYGRKFSNFKNFFYFPKKFWKMPV